MSLGLRPLLRVWILLLRFLGLRLWRGLRLRGRRLLWKIEWPLVTATLEQDGQYYQ